MQYDKGLLRKLPKGNFLPIPWKSHVRVNIQGTFFQKICQSEIPGGSIGERTKKGKNNSQVAIGCLAWVNPLMCIPGHVSGLGRKVAIPKPLVVGTNISDQRQSMRPAGKIFMIKAEMTRDDLLVLCFPES
jgi:hypothetical protein